MTSLALGFSMASSKIQNKFYGLTRCIVEDINGKNSLIHPLKIEYQFVSKKSKKIQYYQLYIETSTNIYTYPEYDEKQYNKHLEELLVNGYSDFPRNYKYREIGSIL